MLKGGELLVQSRCWQLCVRLGADDDEQAAGINADPRRPLIVY